MIVDETNRREAAKAAWWRRTVVKLTPKQLAELTGYRERAIYLFEHGYTNAGKPHGKNEWLRYKMNCAGVDALIRGRRPFTWGC